MNSSLTVVATVILILAGSARGQSAEANEGAGQLDEQSRFSLQITAGAWLPRLNGSARLGPSANAQYIDFENRLQLDDLEPSVNGEVLLTVDDDWQLFFSGFDFSTDDEGVFAGFSDFGSLSLSDGDRYRASFDASSYALEWMVPLLEPRGSIAGPAEGENTALSFSGLLGLRWIDVDQSVELLDLGGREDTGGEWLTAAFGLRMNLQYEPDPSWWIIKRLEMGVAGAIGPAITESGWFWQIRAGMTGYFTDQFGLTFGYRLLQMDLTDGEYELDGGMMGVFVAGTIRF